MSGPEPPPSNLGARGRKFWVQTLASFEPGPAELELLTEVCRTLDLLDAVDRMIREDGPSAYGAAHQVVVHPAVASGVALRINLHRLLAALDLKDDSGGASTIHSVQSIRARTATDARWAGHQKTGS